MIKKAIRKQQKILIIVLAFVVASLAIAVLWVAYVQHLWEGGWLKPPSIEPTPTPVLETVATPSAYATDSGILKIKVNLEEIEKEIGETDLHESGLLPPFLDMEVEFEE